MSNLTARCQFFLTQGLAPSTHRVYLSAQRRYVNFCRQDGCLSPGGALLPADEQSLMRFATVLANNLHYSSVKVYLSTVQSLHIDNGFPHLLFNCLQLQHLLRVSSLCKVHLPQSASQLLWISCRSFIAP